MPDYNKAKIYRISAGDLTYYGSTTQPLCNRMGSHRDDFRTGKGCASALVLQQDPEAKIVLVEDFPCENREQLNAREQHYIETQPCVNKYKAYTGLTEAEYNAQYQVQRYQENKEAILAQHRQYRQDNKEAIKARKSQHYQENREALLAHMNQKHTCGCGGCYTTVNKAKHERTQKHQQWLAGQEDV